MRRGLTRAHALGAARHAVLGRKRLDDGAVQLHVVIDITIRAVVNPEIVDCFMVADERPVALERVVLTAPVGLSPALFRYIGH